jgi:hypothetical protein
MIVPHRLKRPMVVPPRTMPISTTCAQNSFFFFFFFFFSFSTLCNFRLNDLETAKPSTTSQPTLPSNASKPRIPEVTRVAAPVASSSYPSDPRVSSLDFGFGAGNTPSGHSTTTTTTVTSTHNNAPSQQGLSRVSELDFGLNDIASPPKKTTTYTSSVMASKPAASVSPRQVVTYTPPARTPPPPLHHHHVALRWWWLVGSRSSTALSPISKTTRSAVRAAGRRTPTPRPATASAASAVSTSRAPPPLSTVSSITPPASFARSATVRSLARSR